MASILMSPERKLDEICYEDVVRKAQETILADGYHLPIFIVSGSRNNFFTHFTFMPETHDERLGLFREIGQLIARSGKIGKLRQAFFISAGWMSTPIDGKIPKTLPAQDLNRREVLIVAGLEKEPYKKHLTIFGILRDSSKKIERLEEVEPSGKHEASAQVPLLEAFADGYKLAFQARVN